ncbi:hypothetical protein [Croceibacterium mercuriale]|uniref:hypothetical protein n=1 Tax=Croceibacterium mercuriale TaxID=1572751 RepID=UPI00068A31ED|nr:hypothetical protein [Croceibacterium mercuriale]
MHASARFAPHHHLSRHALLRMQQRSIPHRVVELLLDLTDPVDAGDGCTLHRFCADSWAEAGRSAGSLAPRLDRYRNAYAILGADGTVVTAARLH